MRLFYPLSFFETFSYPKNMASLDPDLRSPSNDTLNNLFGAFGSVLGYIGVDAATARSFEHLLWPQDFLYGFSINAAPKLALLHPMRGPLHKAALKTEDTIFNHGLLKGSDKGHMLGTFFFFFFPELGWLYTMHGDGKQSSHAEPLRNCLWARVFMCLNVPALAQKYHGQGSEKG